MCHASSSKRRPASQQGTDNPLRASPSLMKQKDKPIKRVSLNEKWENALQVTDLIFFHPGGLFPHDNPRQCVDGTIMVAGSFSETDAVCPDCRSGRFIAHGNR